LPFTDSSTPDPQNEAIGDGRTVIPVHCLGDSCRAINPVTNLIGGGDGFIQGVASKTFVTAFSAWNPYVQSGKFVFADVLYQSFYPPHLILLSIFPNTFGFNLFLLTHYALASLFVYLYLGSIRLTQLLGIVGGLVFMMCGFMIAHQGHEYIICASVWLPLKLHFIHRYSERLRILEGLFRRVLDPGRIFPNHAVLHAGGDRLYSFLHWRFTALAQLEDKARSCLFRGNRRAGNRLPARWSAVVFGC
jgi:hypothetical protein